MNAQKIDAITRTEIIQVEVFVPIGRAINPITDNNWDQKGVVPDIASPPKQAFIVAYKTALESLIDGLDDYASDPFHHLAEEVKATLDELGNL
ncbi:MAG: hypothetical protein PVG14_19845 [Anaerolineales bacterium]|jgi:hypothetical protein